MVHLFNQKGKFKLALHHLKKAEKKALSTESYELLDIVYSEFIKISHEFLSINPEQYIEERNKNQSKLRKLRDLDNALAVVSFKLKTTQNFTSRKNNIIPLLEETVGGLVKDKETANSLKFRTKIFRAVSQILLSKREYIALEKYLLETYQFFVDEKLFSSSNHEVKLQMLTYLTNACFKNDKIKESLNWSSQLESAMDEHQSKLKEKYQIYYYNALVNNYNVIDKNKSIKILEEVRDSKWMSTNPYLGIFVYINLALNWFDKFDYKKSIKNFQQLQLLDQYKNTDTSLRFKWSIGELIVRYHLNDIDFLDFRIKQVSREFKDCINSTDYARDTEFLSLLKELNLNRKSSSKTQTRVTAFTNSKGNDDELINYSSWLKNIR